MSDELLAVLKAKYRPIEGDVPHSHMDVLHQFGSVSAALLHSILFIPNFLEIDGSILLDPGEAQGDCADRFRAAKVRDDLSLSELEASFNFFELPYLFSNRNTTHTEMLLLAEKMGGAWKSRLRELFPERRFIVTVIGAGETQEDVGVQFFEDR